MYIMGSLTILTSLCFAFSNGYAHGYEPTLARQNENHCIKNNRYNGNRNTARDSIGAIISCLNWHVIYQLRKYQNNFYQLF